MQIKEKIENWAKEVLGRGDFALVHPKEIQNGDFSLILDPETIEKDFEALKEKLIPEIEKIEIVKPRFINIYLSKQFFAGAITKIDENFGQTKLLEDQKIFIEHTQQNPFKEFHIGHLMPNTIGDSVARIIKANGAETKVASYHGDVGLHIAKAIWGKMQKPEVGWGEAYAYGANSYEDNKAEIVAINKKIYDHSDPQINQLYEEGRKSSLDSFEKLYQILDTRFDFHFFESESGEIGKKLVLENIGKVFEEGEEGAIIFKGENFEPKTHTRVFLSKESLPTYEAKEIGLAKIKREKWGDYTKSITVTANEQDSFFKVVEVAIGEVFPELKGKLLHLSHGMLNLPTGKMSSRTGNIITAESLINQVTERILEKIKDRGFDQAEKIKIAEIVAIGAIKYSILRQAIGGDIIFDFEKSLSFEGDSGPYIQYTYVRAKSVLEKSEIQNSKSEIKTHRPENFEVTELERYLYRFPEVVERAGREYAPHHLVTYLTELASLFNSFYAKEQIIDPADPTSSSYKLALTSALATILKNGLHLLGIKVPERM